MTEEEKENFLKRLGYIEQGYLQNGHITVGNCNDIKKAINLIQKQDTEIKNLEEIEKEHRLLNAELIQKLKYYEDLEKRRKRKKSNRIFDNIDNHIPRID